MSIVQAWCDGTPHSPAAIPPLPLHDWRWSGDDPYIECGRCGRVEGDGRVIFEGRPATSAPTCAPYCAEPCSPTCEEQR